MKNDFNRVISYAGSSGDALERLKSTSLSNQDAWTAYRIGEAYFSSGQLAKAEVFFQRSVELEPYNLEFRNKLASAQQTAGGFEKAIQNYQFILNENPKFVSAWINYGYLILTVNKDVEKADEMYAKALALDPDNEQALVNKSGTKMLLGKKEEAKKLLDRVLMVNPDNAKARAMRSQITGN